MKRILPTFILAVLSVQILCGQRIHNPDAERERLTEVVENPVRVAPVRQVAVAP